MKKNANFKTMPKTLTTKIKNNSISNLNELKPI